jgi:hypothetical protein
VVKNSVTGQLRQAWEVPKPAPRPTQISPRRQCKSQAPTEAIYKAHRALKQKKGTRSARLRQNISRPNQSRDMAQSQAMSPCCHLSRDIARSQAIALTPQSKKIVQKAAPSIQQVWVPKGSQPTKPQSQTQPSKAGNSSAPPENVFSRLGQKSVFSRLGSRISLNNLKITDPDQAKKKRRTSLYEEHFSVNTISISYDTDPDTDTEVNMVQED